MIGMRPSSESRGGLLTEVSVEERMDVLKVKDERKLEVRSKPANSRSLRQKQPRLKLNLEEYTVVRNLVLKRDGWRCQECGSLKNLQVHHLKPKSRLGGDVMHNLITLCARCHAKRHGWHLQKL